MPAPSDVLDRVCAVTRAVFHLPDATPIGRETTASDVKGWDSLSHAMLILAVEEEFGADLPLDRTYTLANVGDLADLVAETLGESQA